LGNQGLCCFRIENKKIMAERTIVDVGKFLQKYGLNIGEHPAFGGVGKGHAPTGYHPGGMAIDVRDWRPDMAPAYSGGKPKHWKERTGELSYRAKKLGLFNEALGPGDKGHDTHVHLALEGKKPITEQQLEWLATGRTTQDGKLTDVMPGGVLSTPSPETQLPTNPDQRTQDILEAFLTGTQYKLNPREKEAPKETLASTIKKQLIGQVLGQALNPMSFLDNYKTNDPFMQGSAMANQDILSGMFG
jgi:hypothetical protein